MKAIILSAGQGSRLLPLTEGRPKCLLPIGPRTLIEWQIWALTQGGVNDIAVVVGYHARAVALQRALHDLDGAVHAGAETARRRQQQGQGIFGHGIPSVSVLH
jgi:choline kinase